MTNPFELIVARLADIEEIVRDIKQSNTNTSTAKQTDNLLNVSEAAEFLSLQKSTIYSKVSKKEIPFMKTGNRLYFSEQELISYLKKGRSKTTQDIEAAANTYLAQSSFNN